MDLHKVNEIYQEEKVAEKEEISIESIQEQEQKRGFKR